MEIGVEGGGGVQPLCHVHLTRVLKDGTCLSGQYYRHGYISGIGTVVAMAAKLF